MTNMLQSAIHYGEKLKNKSLLLQGFLATWDYLDVKLAKLIRSVPPVNLTAGAGRVIIGAMITRVTEVRL
jgi:hypothetical protein